MNEQKKNNDFRRRNSRMGAIKSSDGFGLAPIGLIFCKSSSIDISITILEF